MSAPIYSADELDVRGKGTFLAFDIGGTNIRTAIVNDGSVSTRCTAQWPVGRSPVEEIDFICNLARHLVDEAGARGLVRAVGMSMAGLLDGAGHVVSWPNRPSWNGLALRALFEERLILPIILEDDANSAAVAEWSFGAGRGFENLMVMTIGTGVGAGLILGGRLFRGTRGWAGELGHIIMDPGGPECPCGRRGCLQALASGRSLEMAAKAMKAAALDGERGASGGLEVSGFWLGLAVANAVNLLDLEAVVIVGGLSALGGSWWSTLEETLRSNLLNGESRAFVLKRGQLADTAGLLGAAKLAQLSVDG